MLFVPAIYGDQRARSLAYGMVIVLATVVAFLLFPFNNQVWPLYLFLMVGLVHLYATIFSRASVLLSVMWFLAAIAMGTVAWNVLGTRKLPQLNLGVVKSDLGVVKSVLLPLAAVVLWLLVTAYMFLLGSRRTLSSIRGASSYFLATATFTLGFFGVWVFYLENSLVTGDIYRIAIYVGVLLPLLYIAFLFALPAPGGRGTRDWLLTTSAVALVVFATYLVVASPLARALGFLLGQFFPRALGEAPLSPEGITHLPGGAQWRALVTSVVLLVAIAVVVVQGALDAAKQEGQRGGSRGPTVTPSPTVPVATPMGADATSANQALSRAHPGVRARTAAGHAQEGVEEGAKGLSFIATFFGETGYYIARSIWQTVSRAVFVVLPIVAFTLLSMLIVLVLSKFLEYLRHGPFFDAIALWGMNLTILVAVVILCGVAFDFGPKRPSELSNVWRRRRILGVPVVVMAAAALLGGLCYFLVSLTSSALLPMLWPGLTSLSALFTSNIYIVNLAISVVGMALLTVLYVVGTVTWPRRRQTGASTPDPGSGIRRSSSGWLSFLGGPFGISAAVVLLVLAIASLYYGFEPIRTTFVTVTSKYDALAEQRLRAQVPPSVEVNCAHDYLLVTGYSGGLSCQDAVEHTRVSYYLFDALPALTRWYDQTVRARGIPRDTGTCSSGSRAAAEGSYITIGQRTGREHTGRLACYTDRHGAWLVWTDTKALVLVIAERTDRDAGALYRSWASDTLLPSEALPA